MIKYILFLLKSPSKRKLVRTNQALLEACQQKDAHIERLIKAVDTLQELWNESEEENERLRKENQDDYAHYQHRTRQSRFLTQLFMDEKLPKN